jgi:hypothetical protein
VRATAREDREQEIKNNFTVCVCVCVCLLAGWLERRDVYENIEIKNEENPSKGLLCVLSLARGKIYELCDVNLFFRFESFHLFLSSCYFIFEK